MDVDIGSFVPDLALERRLLLDYLDRNHRYRVGGYTTTVPFACIFSQPDLYTPCTLLPGAGLGSAGVATSNASLLDYVNWLKISTTLRGIGAHSSPTSFKFDEAPWFAPYTDAQLAAVTGPNPWRWVETPSGSGSYVPTLSGLGGVACQFLHRTLWENGILAGTSPALYLHDGCNLNSPLNAATLPFNDPLYGRWQAAEGVLFYLNGVALISRAKTFDDLPYGLPEALVPDKANFGMGWTAYFDFERHHAVTANEPPRRKKAYNWSEIGDWTVRKSYANGIGLLGIESQSGTLVFDADTVAGDKTWLAGESPNFGWNYDVRNANVKAVADFDGDGKKEFLLDSTWGIGLIDRLGDRTTNNQRFAMVAGGPSGSVFGGWTYNRDTDAILGTGDFDGDGRDEILVSNSWGLGILRYDGSQLASRMSVPNNTSFGGWILNTNDNKFFIGKFSFQPAPGKSRILITSSWGMGIFELSGGTLTPLASAQNGTYWGAWTVSTGNDVIQGIGDFDGNQTDDILIRNSSGLGILCLNTVAGSPLVSYMNKPSGTWFGGWHYNGAYDVIRLVADLDSDVVKRADILIRNPEWIGVLSYANGTLTSQMVQPQGTMFGSWPSASTDVIEGTGDFTGDGKIDVLVSNRYSHKIGVLTLGGGTMTSQAIETLDGSLLGNWVQTPCLNVVGAGDFDGDAKSEYLVQPRPDGCVPGGVLGDAWTQGAIVPGHLYPRDFSLFALGDVTGFQDIEGPVAAGGNVNTSSFSLNWVAKEPVGLLSGGTVQVSYGTIQGDVKYRTSYSGTGVNVGGTVRQSVPIDFPTAFTKLQSLSQALKGLPPNGNTTQLYGAITLAGSDPDLNVFSLPYNVLQGSYSLSFKVPRSSTVIVNVLGSNVAPNYLGFNTNGQDAGKILWNFPEATALVVRGSIPGSVLAPQAAAQFWWGAVNGTVVVASVEMHSEIHWVPFRKNWLVP